MKRPYDPTPEADSTEAAAKPAREFPKRKVALVMGYSGTGYQGMQRYFPFLNATILITFLEILMQKLLKLIFSKVSVVPASCPKTMLSTRRRLAGCALAEPIRAFTLPVRLFH